MRLSTRLPITDLAARPGAWRKAALAAACIAAAGCYTHIPIEPTAAPLGEEVVVHLDRGAAERVSLQSGYSVRTLRGLLESVDADSLRVSTRAGQPYRGVVLDDRRRTYAFALPEIAIIERRELHRWRTGLVGAGILAGIIFAVDRARVGRGGDQPDVGEPGGPAPAVIRR